MFHLRLRKVLASALPALLLSLIPGLFLAAHSQTPPLIISEIDAALQNITNLVRPERVGYANFWDGNKWLQCRRLPSREFRCESAGETVQPSLERVLTPERISRLNALGWRADPSFGNYSRSFPLDAPTSRVAEEILKALRDGYDAGPETIAVATHWFADAACPPRNGYSQNLAGIVNDSPAMRATALRGCAFVPTANLRAEPVGSIEGLIALYGGRAAAEIQRLRVNKARHVFVSFNAGIGYVQCQSEPAMIYCEAQSAESWPALAVVLTPERVQRLRAAGFVDPGAAPNYSRRYSLREFDDAAIAREALTILYDVYGYNGVAPLKFVTE